MSTTLTSNGKRSETNDCQFLLITLCLLSHHVRAPLCYEHATPKGEKDTRSQKLYRPSPIHHHAIAIDNPGS